MKEGWKTIKLGDACDVINGFAFKSHLFSEQGDDILRISNIQNGYVDLTDVAHFNKGDYPRVNFEKYAVLPNDIVVALSGATTGKFGINKTGKKLYLNQRVAICRESSPKVNHLFLLYYLQTQSKSFLETAEGVAQPNLSTEQMKQYIMPIPPLPEQERIVAELDCLSGVIEKQKQQLKELDKLAQAIFYDMFGEEVAKTQEWATCTVGDVYKFQYGKGNKIPESKGEYPCYGSNGQVGYHTEYNGEDSPIIGHIGAYAGIVNWARGKHFVTYNGVICNLKNKEFDPIYAFYMLKAQNYMSKARGGAAQPFVSYDMLEEPIIFIPPLSLQQEFSSKIEAIEKQKELIKQSLSETETLFNSRMDYYFN